ncbi:ubiquitin carboxyl-terminal hydrolase 19 [Penicillium odoratum]|uniref:ubiquitin carboxyl-terminal hydrolase 19 n=1 Tax=Penicillium odoratum TaxID=1167516 RepID=UPI0025483472|nr:ubiquitin carboxyl-terminal hydrolase 19 [Penicillium odoratum]KAJ5751999.1 ubiquitin carboxyl-terminal hydrolase 19 [Penicillium odoratum]
MDAQYNSAPREIWQIYEDLKEIHVVQFEQAERIARLERRRDEDARLKNVWGPSSPFPSSLGGSFLTEPAYNSPPEPFKGFDQGHHPGMHSSAMGLDGDEEPRRGASRANSVRFDESAIHGYGQASRSNTELPLRTGSGMGSFPMTERSLSHRSDGRLSSSGNSHHSARTNSLGLDTSRYLGSSYGSSPITPPPGWAILGPVPSIIRCWLTTTFSNETLLYAVVCSGSYMSTLGTSIIRKLGLEESVVHEDGKRYVKVPVHLTEASIHQASSRSGSPDPQVPTLTVKFLVCDTDTADGSIEVIIGSDVLRNHSADILLSKDKIVMFDDERNLVSIPLVRPEKEAAFKTLLTAPRQIQINHDSVESHESAVNGKETVGVIGQPNVPCQSTSAPTSTHVSVSEADEEKKPRLQESTPTHTEPHPTAATHDTAATTKSEAAGVWNSWRRPKPEPIATDKTASGRPMKILRPMKLSTRAASYTPAPVVPTEHAENTAPHSASRTSFDGSTTSLTATNPVGGASAFGWLNSSGRSK